MRKIILKGILQKFEGARQIGRVYVTEEEYQKHIIVLNFKIKIEQRKEKIKKLLERWGKS